MFVRLVCVLVIRTIYVNKYFNSKNTESLMHADDEKWWKWKKRNDMKNLSKPNREMQFFPVIRRRVQRTGRQNAAESVAFMSYDVHRRFAT